MLADIGLVVLGLLMLLLAGDALVRGAVNLSIRLGVPALIVGLTVVAFGTSAPELLVSVKAVLSGAPGLALGNVVGSNIANILLVLGVPALISVMAVERDSARGFWMMIAATVLFIVLAFLGPIRWPHALVLLAGLGLMLWDSFRTAQNHRNGDSKPEEELEGIEPSMRGRKIALFLLLGLIGLPMGAQFLVEGSVNIAEQLGVSDALIGLTIVAIGTSLPELATTVMAAIRREGGVALGNVVGSNLFNLLAIIGVAGLVGPIPVSPGLLGFDLWVMLASSLLLGFFIWRRAAITFRWGLALTGMYVLYLTLLIMGYGA